MDGATPIVVPNPDDPFAPPIYEGTAEAAHHALTAGGYQAATQDGEIVTLTVTDSAATATMSVDQAAPSAPSAPAGEPTVHHNSTGTAVTGVARGDVQVQAALKQEGFKWSAPRGFWFLPQGLDEQTRALRVAAVQATLAGSAITLPVVDHNPPTPPASSAPAQGGRGLEKRAGAGGNGRTREVTVTGPKPVLPAFDEQRSWVDGIRAENLARAGRRRHAPVPPELWPTRIGEPVVQRYGLDVWMRAEFGGTTITVHRSGFGAETTHTLTTTDGHTVGDRALGAITAAEHRSPERQGPTTKTRSWVAGCGNTCAAWSTPSPRITSTPPAATSSPAKCGPGCRPPH